MHIGRILLTEKRFVRSSRKAYQKVVDVKLKFDFRHASHNVGIKNRFNLLARNRAHEYGAFSC